MERYERSYGTNYNDKLSTKDIALLMRQWIKSQIALGLLPKASYSVRTSRHRHIQVKITQFEFPLINPNRVVWEMENPRTYRPPVTDDPYKLTKHTKIACLTLDKIKKQLESYNHDGSDIMTDYFDVKFYSDVSFDWQEENEEERKIKESLK